MGRMANMPTFPLHGRLVRAAMNGRAPRSSPKGSWPTLAQHPVSTIPVDHRQAARHRQRHRRRCRRQREQDRSVVVRHRIGQCPSSHASHRAIEPSKATAMKQGSNDAKAAGSDAAQRAKPSQGERTRQCANAIDQRQARQCGQRTPTKQAASEQAASDRRCNSHRTP